MFPSPITIGSEQLVISGAGSQSASTVPIELLSVANEQKERPERFETVDILGVDVAKLTVQQLHRWLDYYIKQNHKELILNVNVHCMNLCDRHHWLRDFLNSAPIIFCDGAGIMLTARLMGNRIPQRITYADWMWQLAEFAAEEGHSFYFVGGQPGIAEKAAGRLQLFYPTLRIAGTHHGYIPTEADAPENKQLIKEINQAAPNILVVGMGMPRQEQWLRNNWPAIHANIALTGGAVFDYVSGELTRAPQWMTNHGMEWAGRLWIEPRRLWKRYVIGNPRYFGRAFGYMLTKERRRISTKLNSTFVRPISAK